MMGECKQVYPSDELAHRPWEHIIEDRSARKIGTVWAYAYITGRCPDRYPLTADMEAQVRQALEEGRI